MSVIFLNGCTSAGKTSIARELQNCLSEPHLCWGIDDVFAMIPERLHRHADGFIFDRDTEGRVRLNIGSIGLEALKAFHRAAATFAASDLNLILDTVILNDEIRTDWLSVLAGLPVFFVGVNCDIAEVERREIDRGDRIPGQARGQIDIVHQDMRYDLEVDTTHCDSKAAAQQIVEAMTQWLPSTADKLS